MVRWSTRKESGTSALVDLLLVAGEMTVIAALAITILAKIGPAHYSLAVFSPASVPHGQLTGITDAMIYGITWRYVQPLSSRGRQQVRCWSCRMAPRGEHFGGPRPAAGRDPHGAAPCWGTSSPGAGARSLAVRRCRTDPCEGTLSTDVSDLPLRVVLIMLAFARLRARRAGRHRPTLKTGVLAPALVSSSTVTLFASVVSSSHEGSSGGLLAGGTKW